MSTTGAPERPQIFDLLTDPTDALDLLQALDLPADRTTSADSPLSTLHRLIASHDTSRVFLALTTFATQFAKMVEDIGAFFALHKVSPNAQLQLKDNAVSFAFGAFRASWVGSLESFRSEDAQEQSEAIATSVASLIEQLRFEDFVHVDRASIGRHTRSHTGLKKPAAGQLEPPRHELLTEVCAEGDYNAIKFALMASEEVLHDLCRRHLSTILQSAFEEISIACSSLLRRMESLQMIRLDAHPAVATLSDDIYLCAMQARALAARIADAERAQEGLGDFVRSSFWRHRWRVYEIWLLTKTIDVLARNGGEVSLQSVTDGVWALPYGQSSTPIASIRFGNQILEVFYQFISKASDSADMPDIFIADRNGKAIMVIDPKHGRSYNRSKVQPVLTRYYQRFYAPLTAIVNYYPISSYPFELVSAPNRTWLLASNIAPGTNQNQRLEHQIADMGCALGYFRLKANKPPVRPTKWTPTAAGIIYWAAGAREVDEPRGAWCYTRERGAHPLEQLASIMHMPVEAVEATDDGCACALRATRELILLSSKIKGAVSTIAFDDLVDCIAWEPGGALLLVKAGDKFRFVTSSGEVRHTFSSPTQHFEPTVAWIGTTGAVLYAHQISLSKVIVYRFTQHDEWVHILDFEATQFTFIELSAIRSTQNDAVILQITPLNIFLITLDSVTELSLDQRAFISASPSGHYVLQPGPISFRANDGISLLKVCNMKNKDSSIPLIRFIGELASSVRWNADESAFGFLAHRRFRSGADDIRVSTAAIGDREAITMSLPSQMPRGFAWISAELIRELGKK